MTDEPAYRFLPLTLSMQTLGGRAVPLVRRGTPLPTQRTQRFSTTADNQSTVSIEVFLGESPIAEKNIFVCKCDLTELPEAPRGEPEIDVTFEVDQNCRIKVTAKEKKSGRSISTEMEEAQPHLTQEKVEEMLFKANEAQKEDEAKAEQIDVLNKATDTIHRAEKYLQDQQKYGLNNSTDRQVEDIIASLGLSVQDDNISAIRDKTKRLEQLLPDTTLGSLGGLFDSNIFGNIFGPPQASQKSPSRPKGSQTKENAGPPPEKKAKSQPEQISQDKKGLFSAGQHFDAKRVVRDLFAQATHEIIVIDAYVGEDVLNLLTVKRDGVAVRLLAGKISPAFQTLAQDFNRQYKGLSVRSSKVFHDRFVIVDGKDYYHFGASLEHLGNRAFMFSKIEEATMICALQTQWEEAWKQATQKL
jgi:Hsp70 protein